MRGRACDACEEHRPHHHLNLIHVRSVSGLRTATASRAAVWLAWRSSRETRYFISAPECLTPLMARAQAATGEVADCGLHLLPETYRDSQASAPHQDHRDSASGSS